MEKLDTLVMAPTATHTHTVIFLHGCGDYSFHFASSLASSLTSKDLSLMDSLPFAKFVFPEPPQPARDDTDHPLLPWMEIYGDRALEDVKDQAKGLAQSVRGLITVIEREVALLQGKWENIVLAGFSQGAGVVVHTLLNLNIPQRMVDGQFVPKRLGGVICLSGGMPFPGYSLSGTRAILDLENSEEDYEIVDLTPIILDLDTPVDNEIIRFTPVLLEHCRDDTVVPIDRGHTLRNTLERFGAYVTMKEYDTGSHWLNLPQGMDDVVEFLIKELELEWVK